MFNEYITNHNEKVDLYLVKYDFELVFDEEFSRDFKCLLQGNLKFFLVNMFLLFWIEFFTIR